MLPTLMIFLPMALLFLALAHALSAGPQARLQERIRRVSESSAPQAARRQAASGASVRRQPTRNILGSLGDRLSRVLPRSDALRLRLEQAGIRLSVIDTVAVCLLGGCAAAAFAYLQHGLPLFTAAGIGAIAGGGLPVLLVRRRIARRKRLFVAAFPDAVDLIIRAVKSGLPVTEALQSAADELPNHVGALFREVTGQIKLGRSLDEALAGVSRRMEIAELRFFVISLAIQQETGGNLAEILQNLVTLMRRRSQVKLKIRAMSSEARASAMIIGALPFVMFGILYLVDSEYVLKLFDDPRGHLMLAASAFSLTTGLAIMSKMVRFEI